MKHYILVLLAALSVPCLVHAAPPSEPENTNLPRLFIAGDSTAAPGNGETIVGWGAVIGDFFDAEKVVVENRARGGRSSRTFITEGHWAKLLADLRAGDVVLIQFGHNDAGAINREPPGSSRPLRARGSLRGLGDESEAIDNAVTGRPEIVYTYGHYMRQMVRDVRERGAKPILLSLTARNVWNDGRLERGSGQYRYWTYQLANRLQVPFIDLTGMMVERFEKMGSELMSELYPNDHTHTNAKGALVHAEQVVAGLKGLRPNPVEGWLSEKGASVEKEDLTWLNLPFIADDRLPTVFLIGDSTVRNGRGDGHNGEWGWGDYIHDSFDETEVNVVNRAVGGLSSRTFYTGPYWEKVKSMMKPGDFVIMQFGHNDNIALNDAKRARGTIKGVGEETEDIDNMVTGLPETVHTYGWYLRQYIREARELGATPIVCSLVPRKIWNEDQQIKRSVGSYAEWAAEVAVAEKAPFVDLHNLVADRYDKLGPQKVDTLFADAHTHTSLQGARLNAACVAEGLRRLEHNPLRAVMTLDPAFPEAVTFRFLGESKDNEIEVAKEDVYDRESGYGYDLSTAPRGDEPWYFSVSAVDGNYQVTITFGSESEASENAVKAETRRLMIERLSTKKGELKARNLIVNTRDDKLVPPEPYAPGGTVVALNDREIGKLHWDEKLTIEINDAAPRVQTISIQRVAVPTVYLVGDSTVTDQPTEPSASWGQMFPRFLKPTVAVANHAESGETMKSFLSGLRFAKVLQDMKKGDYLFIQFAHNDQKEQWPQTYVEAKTTYKAYLKVLIAEARLRGATPVLVTSMQRRFWDEDGNIKNTLGEYPEAMRAVALEEGVTLLDLEPMSRAFYEDLGEDRAPLAFANEGRDVTHHDNYGAYELAKCVVQALSKSDLPLAREISADFRGFDPNRPDELDTFFIPKSPETGL